MQPTTIVYGAGRVTLVQVLKAVATLDLIGILAAVSFSMTIGSWIFGTT